MGASRCEVPGRSFICRCLLYKTPHCRSRPPPFLHPAGHGCPSGSPLCSAAVAVSMSLPGSLALESLLWKPERGAKSKWQAEGSKGRTPADKPNSRPLFLLLLPTLSSRRRPSQTPKTPQPRRPSSPTSKPRPPPLTPPSKDSGQLLYVVHSILQIHTIHSLGAYDMVAPREYHWNGASIEYQWHPRPRHDSHRSLLSGGIRFKESRARNLDSPHPFTARLIAPAGEHEQSTGLVPHISLSDTLQLWQKSFDRLMSTTNL